MELPEIERVEAIRVEPDDLILVTTRHPISMQEAERLKGQLRRIFPNNLCVVMTDATLEVVRPAKQVQDVQEPLAPGDAPDRGA